MALSSRKVMLSAQKGFRRDAITVLTSAADQARGRLLRSATGPDGTIPRREAEDVQRDVGEIVSRVFVGPDGRRPFARDGRIALAPYPAALNKWIVFATAQVVNNHAQFMRKNMPGDLVRWLSAGGRRVVQEQEETRTEFLVRTARELRIFDPDALAEYESAHTWIDPNGYRFSDRIWQTSLRTRQRVDALVADEIRNGTPALTIAKDLERFLLPNRAPLRTNRPYGRDASFDAMRLARTEITHAAGQAFIVAARMNPYVEKIAWNLSSSHGMPDECDNLADRGPYAVDQMPTYPPHPFCLCYLTAVMRRIEDVTAELRSAMQEALALRVEPYVTPLYTRGFLEQVLGSELVGMALRQLATV